MASRRSLACPLMLYSRPSFCAGASRTWALATSALSLTATVSREECRTLFSGFFARLAAEFPRAAAEEENEAIKRCGDYADIMLEGLPALIMRMEEMKEEMKVCTDEV